jgi:hypothetical protein
MLCAPLLASDHASTFTRCIEMVPLLYSDIILMCVKKIKKYCGQLYTST